MKAENLKIATVILSASLALPLTATATVGAALTATPAANMAPKQGTAGATQAAAAAKEVSVREIFPSAGAFPGELAEVRLAGVEPSAAESLKSEIEISIVQDGVAFKARVDSARPEVIPVGLKDSKNLKLEDFNSARRELFHAVAFAVPHGLKEGRCSVSVSYRGKEIGVVSLTIGARPARPWITNMVVVTTGGSMAKAPVLKFQRGKEAQIHISPLIDPQDAESSVIVTFEQANSVRQTTARVSYQDMKFNDEPGGSSFSDARYVVKVKVPGDLALGEAQMSVQVRAGGQLSDPATTPVTIIDPLAEGVEADSGSAPEIVSANPSRVGIGQAVTVFIASRQSLGPDPAAAQVVIEQDSRRVVVKPERNLAAGRAGKGSSFAVLIVRLGSDIVGQARLRVLNPAMGQDRGLSNAVDIQIAPEPLAPKITSAGEPTQEEMQPLRMMREAAVKAGRVFREYDPKYRYLTIRGQDFDYDPNHLIIQLEQNGKSVTLVYDDFSLGMGNFHVVRIPDAIGPGPVKVTLTNMGAGRFSEASSITTEIKGGQPQ
jgi:hypothetical protein